MRKLGTCALAALLGLGVTASADEVIFKNGDKLTGSITTVEGGKLTLKSSVAGVVKVDLKDVKTFSTDQPIEIHLADGTVLNQPVAAAEDGTVRLKPGDAVQPQAVALANVAAINPPPVKWTGAVTVGAIFTTGNTKSQSANVNVDAVRRGETDRITVGAGYFFARQRDNSTGVSSTTTDNWFLAGKYDVFFAPKWYGYANARADRDRIALLDLRVTPGVGLGYQWLETPVSNFSTEGGVTWVYEKFKNDPDAQTHVAARLAYHYDRKINEQVSIFHNLEYLPSVEDLNDFNVRADLGLRAQLTGNMFSEFKAQLDYDATPATGKQKTDVRYIIGMGWSF